VLVVIEGAGAKGMHSSNSSLPRTGFPRHVNHHQVVSRDPAALAYAIKRSCENKVSQCSVL
jgi:hypothetical protein